jgi:uncharacterized membrane protein YeaQ/YmgE (transglycosylase-associated protein family)
MNIRQIIAILLIALVIWFIGYRFLYWLPGGPIISFLLSLVGAIVVVLIARKVNLAERSSTQIVWAVIGSAFTLFAVTQYLTYSSAREIIVNCKNKKVYPNHTYADINDDIDWRFDANTEKNYSIEFDVGSPFNDYIGNPKKKVPSDPSSGRTKPEKIRRYGYFTYHLTCADGTVIDPMIHVPVP